MVLRAKLYLWAQMLNPKGPECCSMWLYLETGPLKECLPPNEVMCDRNMKPFAYLGGSRNRGQDVTEAGCNMKDPLHSDEPPSPRLYSITVLEPPQKSTTRWEPSVAAYEPVGALHIQTTAHGKCSTLFCVFKCRSKVLFYGSGWPWRCWVVQEDLELSQSLE